VTLRFPDSVDAPAFLAHYWQRQSLLLPAAIRLSDLLAPEELAGLACEAGVEARIVHSPPHAWQVRHGPFTPGDFEQLPDSGWTLLVQDVDKYVPAVADLLQHFSFLPSWRIDDIMVSYAAPGGTVGPHIDEYDVFLIQGHGTRTWETGAGSDECVTDLPLRVLAEFDARQSWTLNPGDVLYLPPGLAHHGHSDTACMTYSVGFRAPSIAEMLLSQAEHKASGAAGRYRDADLTSAEADDGLISKAAIDRALAQLPVTGESAETAIIWFGSLVTDNKAWLLPAAPEATESSAEFGARMRSGSALYKHPAVRMAHTDFPGAGLLFVDGAAWPLPIAMPAAALCRGDAASGNTEEVLVLLYKLYCDGKLYWAGDA